jgi:putative membrane protein
MKITHILIAATMSGIVSLAMADDTATGKDQGKHEKVSASEFVEHAASDGLAEVEMGKLASQKASDPELKAFAARLVTDHSKANDELKAIATVKNLEIPKSPGMTHKASMEKFQHHSGGKDFDEDFAKAMVKDHQDAIELFEKAAGDASMDADLRDFAKKTLPTLRGHLKSAQGLESKLST